MQSCSRRNLWFEGKVARQIKGRPPTPQDSTSPERTQQDLTRSVDDLRWDLTEDSSQQLVPVFETALVGGCLGLRKYEGYLCAPAGRSALSAVRGVCVFV